MPHSRPLYISPPIIGRLRIVQELTKNIKGFSLDIGCKDVRLGDINIDNDTNVKPDVLADALNLPFKSETFDLVFLTEVIEHLPSKTEQLALSEIFEVLRKKGTLIMTTPNDRTFFTLLDPTKFRTGHRHYHMKNIQKMVENAGFSVKSIFTAGRFWEFASFLWCSLISYPLKRILNINVEYAPLFLLNRADAEYNKIGLGRYTIFVIAKK